MRVGAGMTSMERLRYFAACQPPQAMGAAFGGHQYADDGVDDPDENAADLTDDEPDDRKPS